MRGAGGRAAAGLGAGGSRVCAGFAAVPVFGVAVTVVETVAAAEVGGLGGGAGEGAEAEVVEGAAAAAAAATGCVGGGASMLFDELPRPSVNLYPHRLKPAAAKRSSMGKSGKKPRESHRQGRGRRASHFSDGYGDDLPSSAYDAPPPHHEDSDEDDTNEAVAEDEQEGDAEAGNQDPRQAGSMPSKFHLYQLSVQSPKGDISYLQKFFLMYVGGRVPLHLQEDFCGTALLSAEWIRTDARRTALGLDLDLESLEWCLENNLRKPKEARLVRQKFSDLVHGLHVNKDNVSSESDSSEQSGFANPKCLAANSTMHAFNALSKRGGIFVMDVYGGTSSERKLRLQRKFPSFTYFWEQEEFDIISRQTRISLHFQAGKKQMLRHAFTYHWRLWSIPEIKDCLEEAGFKSIHVWIREMPNTQSSGNAKEYNADRDVKYEESKRFNQGDAWNAYVVGVANTRRSNKARQSSKRHAAWRALSFRSWSDQ
ncbi:hypothetical protein PR202_ga08970 [Eleusine coracana subsp. coracana]|uniref:S-adenosyl-L-methionine-dependent methyltransferase superfamily protein n=1 Tax=Eleusine coracana subsp. coracana TaxID=191504 RepID=A0AAV5C329_ELECO|nr:hypothetical protein PR202_ga08970 [Eleusine coracana subsp. coracana]